MKDTRVKRLFIDTETTGLDPKKHAIIQIAGIVDIDEQVVEEFDFSMKPIDGKLFETRALEVNGLSMDAINGFNPSAKIFSMFKSMMAQYINQFDKNDKFVFLAYNASFDYGFVKQWFEDHGDNYFGSYFYKYPIDIPSICIEDSIRVLNKLPNLKLESMAKHYDCSPEGKLHDARTDIILAREVYYKALNSLTSKYNQEELF